MNASLSNESENEDENHSDVEEERLPSALNRSYCSATSTRRRLALNSKMNDLNTSSMTATKGVKTTGGIATPQEQH